MINNSQVFNFATKFPTTNLSEAIKSGTADKGLLLQFKDVLRKQVDTSPREGNSPKSYIRTVSDKELSGARIGIAESSKSFRTISANNLKESNIVKSEDGNQLPLVKEDTMEAKDVKSEEDTKAEVDAVLATLAQTLGLEPKELNVLLNTLNIKPENLLDQNKTAEVVSTLTDSMDLDQDQQNALTQIISATIEQVEKAFEKVLVSGVKQDSNQYILKDNPGKNVDEPLKTEETTVNVQVVHPETANITELLARAKVKMEELTQKFMDNPQQVLGQITEEIKIKVVLPLENAQMDEKEPVNTIAPTVAKEVAKEAAEEAPKEAAMEAPKEASKETILKSTTKPVKDEVQPIRADNAEDTSSKSNKCSDETLANETAEPATQDQLIQSKTADDNKVSQLNNLPINDISKLDSASKVSVVQKEVQIQKHEIINQVIEKAKVVLNGEKSEMIMDLKPDNLGKLALKVVTERGIVMAKFVAENQQVKETLEASMQILKDSLEKQGLTVQGFSVSVEQDLNRSFNKYNAFNTPSIDRNSSKQNNSGMIGVAEISEIQQRVNPYLWSESKINLTA